MTITTTVPIRPNWTLPAGPAPKITVSEVNAALARYEVDDITDELTPYLAAAVAELALNADVPWRFGPDDAPVALLRMIAKVALHTPRATGIHLSALAQQLVL